MKVYIVRHGQVLHNAMKQYNTSDEDLTELGIKQAEELRDKIKDMKFDIIISSPLIRAKHTANIININNTKIIFEDRIKERSCGDLSGKLVEVTNREEYWNYYTTIKYGTSEDIKLFFERVYNFLDELKTKDYDNVLIVAHSGVSKAFNGYFNGIDDGKFLNRGLKNCEIKEYELS
jgi:broad specificity phosphatase PhoE